MKKTIACNKAHLFILAAILGVSCTHKPKYPGPLSPEASIKTFQFAEPFKAEVFAAEPDVMDPVYMVFDNKGDAYVVEMADANLADSLKGHGCIIKLTDTDGDGKVDHSVVFASGLTEATSVLPWKDGLIVAAAPNILYLRDTTGDGKADTKEVLYTGFFTNNDEAQITSLRFSVDNWIYANNDGQAGEVTSPRSPDSPKLSMQGTDFRFRLDRNQFERTTGPGQFGQAIDDWGHRFFTENSLHIQQVVIPWRYLHRNPFLPASAAIKNISDHDPIMYQLTDAPYWRAERTRRRNKEYQEHHLDRVEYAKDHFTGSSGGSFYGGDAFPSEYYGSIFTGDVSGNLVHRDILAQPKDTSDPFYTAERGEAEKDKEFLASTDTWFRPTSFTVGPDGDLYVIDMYRQHIETPVSIPDDLAAEMDFAAGSRYGRIYRIVPKDAGAYRKPATDLNAMSSEDLVKLLSSPNRWTILHAHQLLVERQDKSVVPALKALLTQSKDPRTRLHALYVLEGVNALDAQVVSEALKDPAPGVRENGIILSERFSACLPQLTDMVKDSSTRVVFQAALSLGAFSGKQVLSALANVLERFGQNSWFRTAVLSSEAGSSIELLKTLMQGGTFFKDPAPWKLTFLKDFSYTVGARNDKARILWLIKSLSASPLSNDKAWQSASIEGLLSGLGKTEDQPAATKAMLENVKTESAGDINKAIGDLNHFYSSSKP